MLGRVLQLYHAGPGFVGGVLLIAAAALWLLLSRLVSPLRRDLGAWLASAAAVAG
jgi:hypothetical protein